jgi:hypothetical protein
MEGRVAFEVTKIKLCQGVHMEDHPNVSTFIRFPRKTPTLAIQAAP